MTELVRIHDHTNGLHLPVEDVQCDRADDIPVPIPGDGTGLAVDPAGLDIAADPGEPRKGRREYAGHVLDACDGPCPLRRVAAGVPAQLNVRGEHLPQTLHVAVAQRIEEPRCEALAFLPLVFLLRLVMGHASYASGTPGGLFAPMLVLGAQAGLVFGAGVGVVFPGLGIPPQFLIAMFPSVNGYLFIPTYGSLIAAINFDLSGTTKIGKYVLNHSFMIPGLVATVGAVATGLLLAKIVF